MIRFASLIAVLLLAVPLNAAEHDDAKILVTFADPGMSNAARVGASRPGYTRRSSSYMVSVNVRRAADRVARDFGLQVVDEWPIIPLRVHCLVYAIPENQSLDAVIDRLRERPEVESAQPLNTFEVRGSRKNEGADPFAELQHNLDTLELVKAHTWSRGRGSNVTIIDTGADVEHPDLATQIDAFHDFVTASEREFEMDPHGTAVAGVIGAASDNGFGMTGIAPAAEISVLRACWYVDGGDSAVCDSFTLAKALTHALDSDTHIVNLSLGGPSDALLSRLIGVAQQRGIVIVAAAPPGTEGGFPTDVPGVIVVDSWPVAGAARAAEILLAPGEEILVPVPGGGFDYLSGASLSAAHVSGVAALLLALQPSLDRDALNRLLLNSRTEDGASVNACRALASLLETSGCRDAAVANHSR